MDVAQYVNPDKVVQRKHAREAVGMLYTYVHDVLRELRAEGKDVPQEIFWQVLAEECAGRQAKRLVDDGPEHTMGNDEAEQFESRMIPPFGTAPHHGKRVRQVPTAFFVQLTEGGFIRDLRRYVRSARFRERVEEKE